MTRRAPSIALVLAVAALVAGCGGGKYRTAPPPPKLPASLAEQLAAQSDDVAGRLDAGDGCGALASARELRRLTIAAINAGRVPAALQEQLSAAANDLTVRIACAPPPAQQPQPVQEEHDKDKHKHKGHGKHKGEGD